jgi:predicted nucleotidyltransferase
LTWRNAQIAIAICRRKRIMRTMLSTADKQMIADLAAKYGLKGIFLFGSAAGTAASYRDIDLAVEGVRPQDFFRLYGELLSRLSRPVDLIDLDEPNPFTRFLKEEGKLVRVA